MLQKEKPRHSGTEHRKPMEVPREAIFMFSGWNVSSISDCFEYTALSTLRHDFKECYELHRIRVS